MPALNEVRLMGNLTRDVELKTLNSGTIVGEVGLAVNRKWRDQSGNLKEEVTFVDLTIWGKQAETLQQYTAKGDPLFVGGRLQMDQWDDKETGKKRTKLKVVVETFQFLKGRQDGEGGSSERRPATRRSEPAHASEPQYIEPVGTPADHSEDIPF